MTKTVVFALLAGLALGGGGATVLQTQAQAQDAPRPPGMMAGRPDGPRGPGPMGWRGGMMRRMRQFGLVYPAADRALSGPDVQKIAEAFLVYNGNHSWKVTEVTEEPARVTFAYATPDGTAIAHFAMDRHTARPERLN